MRTGKANCSGLESEHAAHRTGSAGIDGKPVNGVGGNGDDVASLQQLDDLVEGGGSPARYQHSRPPDEVVFDPCHLEFGVVGDGQRLRGLVVISTTTSPVPGEPGWRL